MFIRQLLGEKHPSVNPKAIIMLGLCEETFDRWGDMMWLLSTGGDWLACLNGMFFVNIFFFLVDRGFVYFHLPSV